MMKEIWLRTRNPLQFPRFAVVTFFDEILNDSHDLFSECVSFPKKINNQFWGVTVFPRLTKNIFAEVSPFYNNYFLEQQQLKLVWVLGEKGGEGKECGYCPSLPPPPRSPPPNLKLVWGLGGGRGERLQPLPSFPFHKKSLTKSTRKPAEGERSAMASPFSKNRFFVCVFCIFFKFSLCFHFFRRRRRRVVLFLSLFAFWVSFFLGWGRVERRKLFSEHCFS